MAKREPRRKQASKGGDRKPSRRGSLGLKKRYAEGTVNHESWLAFLEAFLTIDEERRTLFRGEGLNPTHARTLYRWRNEGATPVWHKVDSFLCHYGGNFMDFELWCLTESRPIWQEDEPTWWNEEPEGL